MKVKKECDNCGRPIRKCKLKKHFTGELRCHRCIKKHGNNKFYIPENKRKPYNKRQLSQNEREALFHILKQQGLSNEQANYRIRNRRRYLNYFTKIMRQRRYNKKQEEKEKKEINKKFVQGLK